MCMYVYNRIYILFQVLFHYRLLQGIESSSLCSTVGPGCLSLLCIVMCVSDDSKLLIYPSVCYPSANHNFVSYVCFCVLISSLVSFFSIPHGSDIIWHLPFSVWLVSFSMIISRSIHVAADGFISFSFVVEEYYIIYVCVCVCVHITTLSIHLLIDT